VPNAWVVVVVETLSAVGTVGAFAIGFVLLRKEHRREEARAQGERRLQAIKVSAWVEAHATAYGSRELLFHVHNASEMPIYEVSLPMPDDGDAHEAEFIGLVPPGQTVQRPAPRKWLKTYYSPEPVEIEFLDSSGCQWTRDEQGFLTPAADVDHSAAALSPGSRLSPIPRRRRSGQSAGTGSGWLARWRGARRPPGRTGSKSP
jgi:hypothetical protein